MYVHAKSHLVSYRYRTESCHPYRRPPPLSSNKSERALLTAAKLAGATQCWGWNPIAVELGLRKLGLGLKEARSHIPDIEDWWIRTAGQHLHMSASAPAPMDHPHNNTPCMEDVVELLPEARIAVRPEPHPSFLSPAYGLLVPTSNLCQGSPSSNLQLFATPSLQKAVCSFFDLWLLNL